MNDILNRLRPLLLCVILIVSALVAVDLFTCNVYATADIHFESSSAGAVPNDWTYQYHVYRTADSNGTIDVSYSVESSDMSSGSDYIVTSSSPLHWGDGDSSGKNVLIKFPSSSSLQGGKSLTIRLTGLSGNGTITQGTCTVSVNYPTPTPTPVPTTLRLANAEMTGSEGSTLTLTVLREGSDLSGTSKVYILYGSDSETGTAGYDADFSYSAGDMTFGPGETSKSFTATLKTDSNIEGTESFIFLLNSPTGATLGTPTKCKVWVTDVPPAASPSPSPVALPVIRFTETTKSASEGDTFTLTVLRQGSDLSGTSTVKIGYGGSASASWRSDADYTFDPHSLTFGPGESSKSITVHINTDSQAEGTETVNFVMDSPTGATLDSYSCLVSIQNVPPASTPVTSPAPTPGPGTPSIGFAQASASMTEGSGSPVTVKVVRSGDLSVASEVTVYGFRDSIAEYGSDFSTTPALPLKLSFAPGESEKTFTVSATNDGIAEGSEAAIFWLSGYVNATSGSISQTTVTIADASSQQGTGGATPTPAAQGIPGTTGNGTENQTMNQTAASTSANISAGSGNGTTLDLAASGTPAPATNATPVSGVQQPSQSGFIYAILIFFGLIVLGLVIYFLFRKH